MAINLSRKFALTVLTISLTNAAFSQDTQSIDDQFNQQSALITTEIASGIFSGAITAASYMTEVDSSSESLVLGVLLGAVSGYSQYLEAKKNQFYSSPKARLESMAADVYFDNLQLRRFASITEKYANDIQLRVRRIESQFASDEISESEARTKLDESKQTRDRIEFSITALVKRLAAYKYASSQQEDSPETIDFNDNVKEFEVRVLGLQTSLAELDQTLASTLIQ